MGFRGHDDWQDMSDFVVHFTKAPEGPAPSPPAPPAKPGRLTPAELAERIRMMRANDNSGYQQMMSILYGGELRPGTKRLGAARQIAELGDSQKVVSFSEIPLDMLERLVKRRSRYGIGFRKDVLTAKGGAPLWYADAVGEQAAAIRQVIEAKQAHGVDPDDPLWKLTPFIDNPGTYGKMHYRFEWEREWRVVGPVKFTPEDVAFLFIPEELHDDARQFFADVKIEHSGPVYECAYIDPVWTIEQVQKALKSVEPLPDPRPTAIPWWVDTSDYL